MHLFLKKTTLRMVCIYLCFFSIIFFIYDVKKCQAFSDLGKMIPNIKLTQEIPKKITNNRVIVIGDSRMEFIYNKRDKINIPVNFIFDAKAGARIEWFSKEGVLKLRTLLKKRHNYKFHVVMNMGVNDIQHTENLKLRVNEYFKIYDSLLENYPDVRFYILSVNPVIDSMMDKWENNRRSNVRVREFNTYIIRNIKNSTYENISYCDSYHKLQFNLPDGLHFDDMTDQIIIDYIANECVVY